MSRADTTSLTGIVEAALRRGADRGYPAPAILIACSGGPDSTVLADVLSTFVPRERLAVAHFNHRLRGDDSDEDEAFVGRMAQALGLPFTVQRAETRVEGEAAWRAIRLAFFEATRLELGFDLVALGHHADDQLETILIRLLRGTGPSGLRGMAELGNHKLRPMLAASRDSILAYAGSRGLRFRTDETNASPRFLRNRVRQLVIPPLFELAGEFGGKEAFLRRMGKTLDQLSCLQAASDSRTANLLQALTTRTGYFTRVDPSQWAGLPAAERGPLAAKLLEGLSGGPCERGSAERLDGWLVSGGRGISLPGNTVGAASCGRAFLFSAAQYDAMRYGPRSITGPGFWEAACLGIRLEWDPALALETRLPQPGDRVGERKLKEFFLRHRIPWPERRLTPVLARPDSHDVAWVHPMAPPPGVTLARWEFPYSQG